MRSDFKGPLFIVGLSRSGTKLIRDLLNRNKHISIPNIESHFIPKMLYNNELGLNDLYLEIEKSLFVKRFSDREWPKMESLNDITPIKNSSDLLEAVLKYYALDLNNNEWRPDVIWGDKTPAYLRHLDLLKKYFPHCKFVHIIRDPRDRALSVNKTWGKSMNRATELWRREIQESMPWTMKKDDYIEVKYEDLLINTKEELMRVCSFLGVNYSSDMLQLQKPSEKYGKNSNLLNVHHSSKKNYISENKKVIKRLEEIAYPVMGQLGYKIEYAKRHKPVSDFDMLRTRIIDYVNFKISVKIKGY